MMWDSKVSFMVHLDLAVQDDGVVVDNSWSEKVQPGAKPLPLWIETTLEDGTVLSLGQRRDDSS